MSNAAMNYKIIRDTLNQIKVCHFKCVILVCCCYAIKLSIPSMQHAIKTLLFLPFTHLVKQVSPLCNCNCFHFSVSM